MQQTTPVIVPVVGFVVFLGFGLLTLFYPRVVQTYALSERAAKLNPYFRLSALRKHIGSEIYIFELRLIGVSCLGAAGVLFYVLIDWPPKTF